MAPDLDAIAKALRALDKGDIRNWLKRGELLTQAKDLNANETAFRKWCTRQKIAKTTAYKSMAAWRDFGTVPTSGRFSKEAMAILAQSPEARGEAIELSAHKQILSPIARRLVEKHTGPAITRPTLAAAIAPHVETFTVEGGYSVTLKAPGSPTASDLLGVLMQVQAQLRERMRRAA